MPKKDNFIPIYKYAKQKNLSKQTIYKWIREGKIAKDRVKLVEKTVKRLYIDEAY